MFRFNVYRWFNPWGKCIFLRIFLNISRTYIWTIRIYITIYLRFTKGRFRGDKLPCRTLHFCSCFSRSLLFPLSYLSCLPLLKLYVPELLYRCCKLFWTIREIFKCILGWYYKICIFIFDIMIYLDVGLCFAMRSQKKCKKMLLLYEEYILIWIYFK